MKLNSNMTHEQHVPMQQMDISAALLLSVLWSWLLRLLLTAVDHC